MKQLVNCFDYLGTEQEKSETCVLPSIMKQEIGRQFFFRLS